ncbi:hypothetical protein AB6D75_19385 [Vibrio splendidus]
MKNIFALVIILSLTACSTNPVGNKITSNEVDSSYFINETPMPAHSAWESAQGGRDLIENLVKCEGATKTKVAVVNGQNYLSPTKCHLSLLSNSDSETYIRSRSGKTDGRILTSHTSVEGESYEVTMIWSKHVWTSSPEEDGADSAKYQIGVGAKIVAYVDQTKAGINLGDISGLAASAEANELTGSISFKRIGINGKLSEIILPGFTDTLSRESVTDAVESMQKIQLLLYSDEDVSVKPSVLAHRVLTKKRDKAKTGLGWMHVGTYDNLNVPLSDLFKFQDSSLTNIGQLNGQNILLEKSRNIRVDRPRFPYYAYATISMTAPANCTVKVEELNLVGKNQYWAFVSDVSNCTSPKNE